MSVTKKEIYEERKVAIRDIYCERDRHVCRSDRETLLSEAVV